MKGKKEESNVRRKKRREEKKGRKKGERKGERKSQEKGGWEIFHKGEAEIVNNRRNKKV